MPFLFVPIAAAFASCPHSPSPETPTSTAPSTFLPHRATLGYVIFRSVSSSRLIPLLGSKEEPRKAKQKGTKTRRLSGRRPVRAGRSGERGREGGSPWEPGKSRGHPQQRFGSEGTFCQLRAPEDPKPFASNASYYGTAAPGPALPAKSGCHSARRARPPGAEPAPARLPHPARVPSHTRSSRARAHLHTHDCGALGGNLLRRVACHRVGAGG